MRALDAVGGEGDTLATLMVTDILGKATESFTSPAIAPHSSALSGTARKRV